MHPPTGEPPLSPGRFILALYHQYATVGIGHEQIHTRDRHHPHDLSVKMLFYMHRTSAPTVCKSGSGKIILPPRRRKAASRSTTFDLKCHGSTRKHSGFISCAYCSEMIGLF